MHDGLASMDIPELRYARIAGMTVVTGFSLYRVLVADRVRVLRRVVHLPDHQALEAAGVTPAPQEPGVV
ncbi:hypothetical protein [Burkholderia ambifaria]|uniref:hypothetical protein n=1 Tax=Burkholderia ambifaria TaxID=152480 RepID=UPI00158B3133|nr:hypothetical protein [Burkholderia ambifaria]